MAIDPCPDDEIVFGPFRADLDRRTLCRDGKPIPLRKRSFDLLCVLIASRGKLVTKDELMDRVWPGLIVEENTVQVHMSALRKALGEDLGGQRFVLTVPGQGYRFIGETVPQGGSEAGAGPPLPDKPSIAVMPFRNMSTDPDQDYFADGIVEDIITALTRVRWLFVIARNSSFSYKGRTVDVKRVGRELGVRYLLEGSVRKSAERVRITGQLVDSQTGSHLWADRFDGGLTDIFALQEDIAISVVGAITLKMEQAETERARRKPTENLDAYDYYLRGLANFYRERREANRDALHQFHRAIEIDSDFALAHGMAARCYIQRQNNGWMEDRPRERQEATRLARRAAELAKDDADALSMAGNVLVHVSRDVKAGASLINRALALNSNLANAWYFGALVHVFLGEPETAIEQAAHAMRLSPLDPRLYVMLMATALAHFVAGRYDEAVEWAERALRVEGQYQPAMRVLAVCHALAGREQEAIAALVTMRRLAPNIRISDVLEIVPFCRPDDLARYAAGLRAAGLPD